MKRITPCLWYDNNVEEAVKFYVSIFKNSRIGRIARYPEGSPGPTGSVMTVEFKLNGRPFIALNGGPLFKFNEAVSFVVYCETQAELNRCWEKLLAGGREQQCGWLKDKYGLSWQLVPTILDKLMADKDPAKSQRVMQAVLQMVRLDIKKLKKAHAGK